MSCFVCILKLLLKDTLNKGQNTFNLLIKKDKSCGHYRTLAIQFYLLKRTTSVCITKIASNLTGPKVIVFIVHT